MLSAIKKNNKGFTLIELIVVVAIIGILMTIAVPRLLGFTEMARETADDQLAAIYKNTFEILLGSGKLANDSGGDVEVVVNKSGVISYQGDNELTNVDAFPSDTAVTPATLLTTIQNEYVSSADEQVFKSRKYTQEPVDGILITITQEGDVSVAPN